jgi:flagellar basal-body rod modification protein FlgD
MIELNPIAQALPGAARGSADQATGAAASLADNFDTFLTLLTEQLQNQDPLDPMDAQQFTEQLVQFSSVEQQIASNQSLETILALQAANARMSATDYVGRNVTVSSPVSVLENGEARWDYSLPRQAASSELRVTTDRGRVVATRSGQTGQGAHVLNWDGRDAAGNQAPAGLYRLEVVAKDADGQRIDAPVRVTRHVTGVEMSGDTVMVELGPLRVPSGSVIAVREANSV